MGRNSHIPAADTEQFIIERAAELFNKQGYLGTSLSDLERATGLTKGSIYANFQDKKDVSLRVFDFNYQNLRQGFTDRISEKMTAKDKLLTCIDFYINYFPTLKSTGGCVIQNTLVEADDTNIALFERARGALKSWKDTIQSIFEAGIKDGQLSSELDAEQYAFYFVALIEGAILVGKSLDSQKVFEGILGHFKTEITML
ncbi:MAG: TetR/AcrR family transcriptional regulator [Ginsengibacter sp.]